jgi:hypothetical protein
MTEKEMEVLKNTGLTNENFSKLHETFTAIGGRNQQGSKCFTRYA